MRWWAFDGAEAKLRDGLLSRLRSRSGFWLQRRADLVQNLLQRSRRRELIDHRADQFLVRLRQGTSQLADDLNTLDGINAQIGFEVGIQGQHVGGVAGSSARDPQQRSCNVERR